MPNKAGRLTGMERVFAERLAATGDAVYAAEKAGYSSPAARASQNLQNAAVMEHSRELARVKLRTIGAQVGVDTLVELAEDKAQPAGARRAAASDLVKLSGISAAGDDSVKEPHEMDAAELAAAIDKLKRAAASRLGQGSDDRAPVIELQAERAGVFD